MNKVRIYCSVKGKSSSSPPSSAIAVPVFQAEVLPSESFFSELSAIHCPLLIFTSEMSVKFFFKSFLSLNNEKQKFLIDKCVNCSIGAVGVSTYDAIIDFFNTQKLDTHDIYFPTHGEGIESLLEHLWETEKALLTKHIFFVTQKKGKSLQKLHDWANSHHIVTTVSVWEAYQLVPEKEELKNTLVEIEEQRRSDETVVFIVHSGKILEETLHQLNEFYKDKGGLPPYISFELLGKTALEKWQSLNLDLPYTTILNSHLDDHIP